MSLSARRAAASVPSSLSRGLRRPRSPASSTSPSAPALRRLDSRTFLRGVVDRVQVETGTDYPPFHATAWSNMAQLWSGNKQLHYEAWIRERLGVIEVGLHFEADALTNARLLAAFRARERAIHRALGGDVRIETWDKGWARVWEPLALANLDPYVSALEPLLRAEVPSDVAWSEPKRRR